MKPIITIMIFLIGLNIYADTVKPRLNKKKSLSTIFLNNKGNCYETRNGGFTYKVIPYHEAKYLTEDIKTTKPEKLNDRNVTLYPNPITDNSTMEIELKERSNISVYSYDSQNNRVTYFEGIGQKGKNSMQIQADKNTNGSMILFIDVNGKISIYKAIVAK